MAKFLIEVNEEGITHDEIIELLTGDDMTDDGVDVLDSEDVKVTRIVDDYELPADAVYTEDKKEEEDPDFPEDAK